MILRVAIFMILLSLFSTLRGQTIIPPGQTRTITAEDEALMVVPRSQLSRALQHSLELELADSTIWLLQKKCDLLQQVINRQKEVIRLQDEGYRHYRKLWEETDRRLETAELENVKWRQRWTITVLSGLTVSTVAVIWAIAK